MVLPLISTFQKSLFHSVISYQRVGRRHFIFFFLFQSSGKDKKNEARSGERTGEEKWFISDMKSTKQYSSNFTLVNICIVHHLQLC